MQLKNAELPILSTLGHIVMFIKAGHPAKAEESIEEIELLGSNIIVTIEEPWNAVPKEATGKPVYVAGTIILTPVNEVIAGVPSYSRRPRLYERVPETVISTEATTRNETSATSSVIEGLHILVELPSRDDIYWYESPFSAIPYTLYVDAEPSHERILPDNVTKRGII